MNKYFERPLVLLATFAVIPAAIFVIYRFKRICEQLLISGHTGLGRRFFSASIYFRTILFSLAWVFLSLAASGPQWGTRFELVREQGSTIIFALDISRSMTVSDISPDRLSFAAQYISLLAEELQGIPCGLVLFKGDAVLSIPLTTDRRALMDMLSIANPDMISVPGSSPGSALNTAVKAFPSAQAASRYILLFSDGEETAGSIADAASELKAKGITLITLGVGTKSGAELDAFPGPDKSRMHRTQLNEGLLKEGAQVAGGESRYIFASEPGSALSIITQIQSDSLSGRKTVHTAKIVKRYPLFLIGALLSFSLALAIGGGVWKKS